MIIDFYNDDCFKVMKSMPSKSIDLVLCDLPYGGQVDEEWDKILPLEKIWKEYDRLTKDTGTIILFCQKKFTIELCKAQQEFAKDWDLKEKLIWKKSRNSSAVNCENSHLPCYEEIAVFSKCGITQNSEMPITFNPQGLEYKADGKPYNYPTNVLEFGNVLGGDHPTQKPLDLMEYLVRTYSNEGWTILDNTMGSGTTNLAAARNNRNSIGIELEKKYFDIAVKRLEKEGFQPEIKQAGKDYEEPVYKSIQEQAFARLADNY